MRYAEDRFPTTGSAAMARKSSEDHRRLTVRISEENYRQLCELRLALHLPSDSATIRALIALHHRHADPAMRRARRDPGHRERVDALVSGRQIEMWGGR